MSNSTNTASVGNVYYPVGDVENAVEFYAAIGLPSKFSDGNRFAALDGGSVTFALAGAEEDVTAGRVAASLKVDDVETTVNAAVSAGATVLSPAQKGPHEIRAVIEDPWGNPVVIYAKL